MANVQLRNEILFTAPTRVGLLADITGALHEGGVNILAIGAFEREGVGEFLLLTSNNRATGEILASMGGGIDLTPVLVAEVENAPGQLARMSRAIADAGVNVQQVIATTTSSPTAMIVMRTDDEARVLDLLEDV
jgi:hypothetical protein